jgi:propionyl-CoA carboxylase alpha chain
MNLYLGVTHNVPLLRNVISHPRFISGKISTKFLQEEYPTGFKGASLDTSSQTNLTAVAALVHARRSVNKRTWINGGGSMHSSIPSQWTANISLSNGFSESVVVKTLSPTLYDVTIGDRNPVQVSIDWTLEAPIINAVVGGTPITVQYLDVLPLGYRLQYLGTKVKSIFLSSFIRFVYGLFFSLRCLFKLHYKCLCESI